MASNFPIPSIAAAGTAPAISTGAHIPAPAANATPLPALSPRSPSAPHRPVTAYEDKDVTTAALVLQDGSSYQGISFGSEKKSISGECVFQTGKFFFFAFVKHVKLKKKTHKYRYGWLPRIIN